MQQYEERPDDATPGANIAANAAVPIARKAVSEMGLLTIPSNPVKRSSSYRRYGRSGPRTCLTKHPSQT